MPTTETDFVRILAILVLLQPASYNIRVASSSVVTLGASVICGRIPGLTAKQRQMCVAAPDAMVALGDGIRLGHTECQSQFRWHRWNCSASALGRGNSFGHVILVGSREAAFTYAVSSAGVAYAIAAACSRGNISTCGCASPAAASPSSPPAANWKWKWSGCSVDAGYGMRLARRFLDAREIEGDSRSLMNLHNNKAGRKAVKTSLLTECKCHGVSGSCTMKTCWKTLPPFRQIGDSLMKKYWRAKSVTTTTTSPGTGLKLVIRRTSRLAQPPPGLRPFAVPRRSELVYLESSPNYCDRDPSTGSLGTQGRQCNRTSKGMDSCDLLCCGRGYNTHQFINTSQCHCKFHWCCYVRCDTCSERTEQYTCK